MALDGRLLRLAKDSIDADRRAREAEYARRREEIYALRPRIRELDEEISGAVADAAAIAFSRGEDVEERINEIGEKSALLQEDRRRELLMLGYPPDWLDEKYACEKCRDTGYCGGELCTCLLERYEQEQKKDLSALMSVGPGTFDAFDRELYDDTPDPAAGISPRQSMDMIYEICVRYAERFPNHSDSLFFTGGTGLGKTFLSSCIAKVVASQGFSVVYETAGNIFARFEDDKFSRPNAEQARADIKRYLNCDLLIMDDLGTEMASAFVTSALYTVVNTRLTHGKKTIISSNLQPEELSRRYSPQIASRLIGEYRLLRFCGSDIRLKLRK